MPRTTLNRKDSYLDYRDFGGYNTRDADITVADNELTGGQNVDNSVEKALSKRKGHSLHGNFMGSTTSILDLITHEPEGGTTELLAVYDTSVMRYVAGTWTALTDVTMTTNKKADHAYFPLTAKTYITNGTDNVVKYASGTAGVQTDGNFKKGSYIVHFKNRLLTSVGNILWYTDLGVDTFSANNYVKVEGDITGLEVYFDKVLVFTKRKVFVIQNFTFNGVAAGPEALIPLRTDFGAIYDRTIKKVNDLVYFMGQDSQGLVAIYVTDATSISIVSDKISPDLNDLVPAQLTNACAINWGRYYRISVTPTGQTINTKEYLWDSINKYWLPPFTNSQGGFSCYTTLETSGQLDIYAGSQTEGLVYKLNQVDYDEIASEKYTIVTAGADVPIDGGTVKRAAQSFKLSDFTNLQDVPINSIFLKLKKNTGTTTDLVVRIETDNNGVPSGTLVDAQASATISAFTSTSYTYKKATFTDVTIKGNTTYWIVCKHATEGSGTSQYYWGGDSSSPTYTDGNLSTYTDSTSGVQTYNPNAAAVDGYVSRIDSESFSDIRTGSGNNHNDNGTYCRVALLPSTTSKWAELTRSYLLFDTSTLPDDAVITSAVLSIYPTYKVNTLSQSMNITAGVPTTGSTALVNADYAVGNFGADKFTSDLSIDSIVLNQYNDFTLNASGISAIDSSGVTKLALRLVSDIEDSAPTWSLNSSILQFDSSEGTNKPKLVITYTSASGSAIWTSDATKDLNFLVFTQGNIDGYGDTKAFFLAPQGQKTHLRDIIVTAMASGNYNMELGINQGIYNSFDQATISLKGGNYLWGGSTSKFGTMLLGGANKVTDYIQALGFRGIAFKFRFRNRYANQPFTIYSFRARHQIIDKFR
jgi:hypothetical protein